MPAPAAAVSLPVPVTTPVIGVSFPIHAYAKLQEAGAPGASLPKLCSLAMQLCPS